MLFCHCKRSYQASIVEAVRNEAFRCGGDYIKRRKICGQHHPANFFCALVKLAATQLTEKAFCQGSCIFTANLRERQGMHCQE